MYYYLVGHRSLQGERRGVIARWHRLRVDLGHGSPVRPLELGMIILFHEVHFVSPMAQSHEKYKQNRQC